MSNFSLNTEMKTTENRNDLIVTRTKVQHNEDENNRHLFENLEMKRLGLPTQFTSAKSKRFHKKKKRKNRNSIIDRMLQNWNEFQISSFDDSNVENIVSAGNDLPNNDEEEEDHLKIQHHFIESNVSVEMPDIIDEYYSDEYSNDEELLGNLQEDDEEEDMDISSMEENEDDLVEEVPTNFMAKNSYDYQDMQVNNNNNNNQRKTNHTDGIDIMKTNSVPSTNNDSNKVQRKSNRRKSKIRWNIYWRQRFILFSRFNQGIRLDKESWYSVTPESIAKHIAERLQNTLSKRYPDRSMAGFIVMDPFCGAGGNIIQFALQPLIRKVYAIDIDPEKIAMAKHNARIYECDKKIEFICGDFFQFTKHNRFPDIIDACFYSPPWGGPDYIKLKKFSLNHMIPNGFDICRHTSKYLTQNIIMLLPRNFDEIELQKVSDLVYNVDPNQPTQQARVVELERNMIFNKVKTITAYFGDTIDGFNQVPTKVLFETK
uniref:Trimethylguanosine synthase n=2 Tax=Dermatophagoides pteronyssinus TaxID=6956 RepID=A0A6P6XV06_DERPT|nr:trimethylguanosine synthase-like [Dermatophagoides pteronyssinus]